MSYFPNVIAEYRTTPPLKEVYESPYGRIFIGTREALLDTGLFRAEWFPGELGMRRHTSRVHHDGRDFSIERRSARLFEGFVGFTAQEQAQRDEIKASQRRLEGLHAELAAIPCSADDYRRMLAGAELHLSSVVKSLAQGDSRTGGYHYDEDTYFRIAQCLSVLIQLLMGGKIKVDPAKREAALREVYERHGTEAPTDAGFAQFLARVSTPGAELDDDEGGPS